MNNSPKSDPREIVHELTKIVSAMDQSLNNKVATLREIVEMKRQLKAEFPMLGQSSKNPIRAFFATLAARIRKFFKR